MQSLAAQLCLLTAVPAPIKSYILYINKFHVTLALSLLVNCYVFLGCLFVTQL